MRPGRSSGGALVGLTGYLVALLLMAPIGAEEPSGTADEPSLVALEGTPARSWDGSALRSSATGPPPTLTAHLDVLDRDPARLTVHLADGSPVLLERRGGERRGRDSFSWWGASQVGHTLVLTVEEGHVVGRWQHGVDVWSLTDLELVTRTRSRAEALAERRLTARRRGLAAADRPEAFCRGGRVGGRDLTGIASRASEPPLAHRSEIVERAATEVDVMVVYSPAARAELGGDAAPAAIQSGVDFMNLVLSNSGVSARARLVHSVELSQYAGLSNLDAALDRLLVDDQVADLRNTYGADSVTVVMSSSEIGRSECGVGFVMMKGDTPASMAPKAFSSMSAFSGCGLGESIAHEVGHNLGLNHDPENSSIPRSSAYTPEAYGHTSSGWRTVMSYGIGSGIPYYSNPDVYYQGVPTGIAGDRDNASALATSVSVGASFRNRRFTTPGAPSGLAASADGSGAVTLAWHDNATNETAYHVEYKTRGASWRTAAIEPAGAVAAQVGGLVEGKTYSFRARAESGGAFSAYSNVVDVVVEGSGGGGSGGTGGGGGTGSLDVPDSLATTVLSERAIRLSWVGGQSGADVDVQRRSASEEWHSVTRVPATDGSARIGQLTADTPYAFRLRTVSGSKASAWSEVVAATTAGRTGACREDGSRLCLLGGAFELGVNWRRPDTGESGTGRAVEIAGSEQSGLFWFFEPGNVELMVKMLDGRGVNEAYWYFHGALTDVEYWITVRDTESDETRTYYSPPSQICGRADTGAFSTRTGAVTSATELLRSVSSEVLPRARCYSTPTRLCLQDGRFSVEVDFVDPGTGGRSSAGVRSDLSGQETGFFWFFDEANLELAVKLLDGRGLNGKFWVYWGALSDVEYTIDVVDWEAGRRVTYTSPASQICGGADTSAL